MSPLFDTFAPTFRSSQLLAEDLKGLSVASPSPPQCGVDEQAMFGETSPHNVPLLTSTSTESTSSP